MSLPEKTRHFQFIDQEATMILFAGVRSRIARQLIDFNIASSKTMDKSKISIHGNENNFTYFHGKRNEDQNASNGLKVANSIMQDGADLLGTPVRWLKDMQQNWLVYVVCAAIILVCSVVVYCAVRSHCSRRRQASSKGWNLADLATIIAMKNTPSPSLALPQLTGRNASET